MKVQESSSAGRSRRISISPLFLHAASAVAIEACTRPRLASRSHWPALLTGGPLAFWAWRAQGSARATPPFHTLILTYSGRCASSSSYSSLPARLSIATGENWRHCRYCVFLIAGNWGGIAGQERQEEGGNARARVKQKERLDDQTDLLASDWAETTSSRLLCPPPPLGFSSLIKATHATVNTRRTKQPTVPSRTAESPRSCNARPCNDPLTRSPRQ